MPTTFDKAVLLADELAELTNNEIGAFASNPSDRLGGERWTVDAYGESHSGLSTDTAYNLLFAWACTLRAAGARALTAAELRTAVRVILHRTASGGWRIVTQEIDGEPVAGMWDVPFPTGGTTVELYAAATASLREHGFEPVWGWALDQSGTLDGDTSVRYITVAVKA